MQEEPKKAVANWNEFAGSFSTPEQARGVFMFQAESPEQYEAQREVATTGLKLVRAKIGEVLGSGSGLIGENMPSTTVKFGTTTVEHPNVSGYFSPGKNEIVICTDTVEDPLSQLKTTVHELFHLFSHNGFDARESTANPLMRKNNVGFSRPGLDIRSENEGQLTSDYFLSFNEAVTEQLAIDTVPGAFETYADYRGLLSQVIDDTVQHSQETIGERGAPSRPLTREQVKRRIYEFYFMGDLEGFTNLLQKTYEEYGITEQQFGLMTHRDDLPTMVERKMINRGPNGPAPTPMQIARAVQARLDTKTAADYPTDVEAPGPIDGGFGQEYDDFIADNKIAFSHQESIDGNPYDFDTLGLFIYRGREAAAVLNGIRAEFDALLIGLERGETDVESIGKRIDEMLFNRYYVSMLSDGFRDFYVYKHQQLASLQ